MEDLARTVAIIVFFPLIASPMIFLINWKFPRKLIMIITFPISLIAAALGLFLLLSEIGIVARAFGLWGLFFSLANWRATWNFLQGNKREQQ